MSQFVVSPVRPGVGYTRRGSASETSIGSVQRTAVGRGVRYCYAKGRVGHPRTLCTPLQAKWCWADCSGELLHTSGAY